MKEIVAGFILCWLFAVQSVAGSIRGYGSFEGSTGLPQCAHNRRRQKKYLEHVSSGAALDDDGSTEDASITSSSNELLGYFRTVPREHWSCCMLGLLAGSKGFHCQAQYYFSSGDATQRNVNRAQTARQPGAHGRHRDRAGPRWSYSISRSFQRCVVGGDDTRGLPSAEEGVADEFHSCCYAAAEERRQLRRARRYRRRHHATSRR